MRVMTESGSEYDFEANRMRRVNHGDVKRADGEWVKILSHSPVEVGSPIFFVLEPLGKYGPDDHGNENGGVTTRITTPVVAVFD